MKKYQVCLVCFWFWFFPIKQIRKARKYWTNTLFDKNSPNTWNIYTHDTLLAFSACNRKVGASCLCCLGMYCRIKITLRPASSCETAYYIYVCTRTANICSLSRHNARLSHQSSMPLVGVGLKVGVTGRDGDRCYIYSRSRK